jgi:hypothetical protein
MYRILSAVDILLLRDFSTWRAFFYYGRFYLLFKAFILSRALPAVKGCSYRSSSSHQAFPLAVALCSCRSKNNNKNSSNDKNLARAIIYILQASSHSPSSFESCSKKSLSPKIYFHRKGDVRHNYRYPKALPYNPQPCPHHLKPARETDRQGKNHFPHFMFPARSPLFPHILMELPSRQPHDCAITPVQQQDLGLPGP